MSPDDRPNVEQLRAIGLTMGSWDAKWYIGWTTDERKALAAEELNAVVRPVTSRDPQFSGWEVSTRREPHNNGR